MLFVLLAPLVFPGPVLFGRLNSRDDVGHSGFRPWAATVSFSFTVRIALLGGASRRSGGFPPRGGNGDGGGCRRSCTAGRRGQCPAARSSPTRRVVTGTAMPWRSAARSNAPPIASSSSGRPASASRCMEDLVCGGKAS